MKFGQFQENLPDLSEQFNEEAKKIQVGQRCKILGEGLERKGEVKFVGKTEFQQGYWVGIQLDEPHGKNNGSVQGIKYFECPEKYGIFVRPTSIEVGDFPEDDLLDEI